ncbi:hypothetical protein RHGRI_022736 [Rhododendron griersonianum]|uniref:Bacterial Ig-like domain-containing protein n=1 Tax=Rhododendron griersonianum TaxID=479676 RepID=A0AAV6J591_9ERIC|nr:hypothetical protein RHGRI_022736 [Rhododendron griersonianum]
MAESTVLIRFDRAPPARSRFSTAVFRYSVTEQGGSSGCKNNGCSIHCKLDGQTLRSCPADTIVLKNLTVNQRHNFAISINTGDGNSNSSSYSWFIDTTPPTATISTEQSHTNAGKVEIVVAFSEPCSGKGGFKCINSSNCDVIVNGPAHVDASSVRAIKPDTKYSLNIVFSQGSIYARAIIKMADKMCTDKAGNQLFTRSNGSMLIVHLDRRPVLVDLWTSVPSYEVVINGVPRTVIATNETEDLKVFLDFSIPMMNATEQIQSALRVNAGNFIPSHGGNHGNRSFAFELKNISRTQIVTVELEAASLFGRTGTPVSPVAPISFLYGIKLPRLAFFDRLMVYYDTLLTCLSPDSTEPGVGLSSSSSSVTKESNIAIIIEFTKPVFGFKASKVEVEGGSLTRQLLSVDFASCRFEELSRALYSLTVRAVSQDVSVIVPAGQANDISGNLNLASNSINIRHVSTPSISIALHSFMTAGILVTSLAAAVLSISSANLGAVGTLASGGTVFPDPSMNLHGMVGHLQVFVLADWILVSLPVEYSETTKGLRWLLPREKLPWKKKSSSMWPSKLYTSETKLEMEESHSSIGIPYNARAYHAYQPNLTTFSSNLQQGPPIPTVIYPKSGWLPGQQNITMKNIQYGLPLRSSEYFTYFLRGEPLSASSVMKRMQTYTGWQNLEMNLFWLGVGGISLLVAHLVTFLFLRWRTQRSVPGILSVPRFELFLLILMLPSISQSAAFVIRGGTTGGVLTGTLLLAIPAGFILSVFLFLAIAIFYGSFVQYTEVKHIHDKEPWRTKLQHFLTGRPTIGKWLYREGLPSSFLPRFGILFENRRGPPFFVLLDQNDPNNKSKWTESGLSGIGRMRALSSDESNEEAKVPPSKRFLGYARSSYIILDLLRRTSLGIVAGAYPSGGFNQGLFALIITSVQFLYLFTLKPYISRGVNAAEGVSLLCEAGLFILSTSASGSSLVGENNLGFAMLGLLLLAYVSQIVNEWHAIMKSLLRLSQPQDNSFKSGLKNAAKGLLIPFLPRRHWSGAAAGSSSQPKTGLDLVPSTSTAMNATVVPVVSPGLSPNLNTASSTNGEATLNGHSAGEGKQLKGIKLEPKSEMKKLRQLARASFAGVPNYEEGSTSYGL